MNQCTCHCDCHYQSGAENADEDKGATCDCGILIENGDKCRYCQDHCHQERGEVYQNILDNNAKAYRESFVAMRDIIADLLDNWDVDDIADAVGQVKRTRYIMIER